MKNATKKPSVSPRSTIVSDINKMSKYGGLFDAQIVTDTKMASNSAAKAIAKEIEAIKATFKKYALTISIGKKILAKRRQIISKKAEASTLIAEKEASELSERMSTYDYDTAIQSEDVSFLYAQVKLAKALMSERKKLGKNVSFFKMEAEKLESKAKAILKGQKEVVPTAETKITKLDEVVFDPDAPIAETFAQEIGAKFGTIKDPTFVKNYGEDSSDMNPDSDEIEDTFISTALGYFVKIEKPDSNLSIQRKDNETIKSFVKRAEDLFLSIVYKTVGNEDLNKIKRIVKFAHLGKTNCIPSKAFFNNHSLYAWLEKFNETIFEAKKEAIAA